MGGNCKTLRLRVERLSVSRGSFRLGPLSLEFGVGLHAVLGPNGAGKTTLLESIAGILEREGSVELCDTIINASNAWMLVTANFAVPPLGFSARVIDYARIYISRVERRWTDLVTSLFERMGVSWMLWKRWEELSAGQQSLASTLVALAKPTKLVLLDEPFNHLDPYWLCRLSNLLRKEARHRVIIYTTHELYTPFKANTITLLREGTLIAHGCPRDTLKPGLLERLYGVRFIVERESVQPLCRDADDRRAIH